METQNKIEVMQAYLRGETIEAITANWGSNDYWTEEPHPEWDWSSMIYRVKPEEITYDTMDWTNVDEKYKYAARDANGHVLIYTNKPVSLERFWAGCDEVTMCSRLPDFFIGHKTGNCDWKDSLIKREDGEDWTKIDHLLREGRVIDAIKQHRDNGGRGHGHTGPLVRSLRESKDAIDGRRVFLSV